MSSITEFSSYRGGKEVTNYAGTWNPFIVVANSGWIGVTVFLMVSGYSLGFGLQGKTVSWSRYFGARWLRVGPLYMVMLFVAAVTSTMTFAQFLATATMLPVPQAVSPGPWLWVAWSVRIEFLLYFILPALVYLAASRTRRWKLIGIPLLLLTIGVALTRSGVSPENLIYWNFVGRTLEFLVGFVIGDYTLQLKSLLLSRLCGFASLFGFLGITAYMVQFGSMEKLGGLARLAIFFLTIVLVAAALVWAAQTPRKPLGRTKVAVTKLGTWSYSTYMWHMIVLTFFALPVYSIVERTMHSSLALAASMGVLVLMTLFVSWASFSTIEEPFLRMRPKYVR